MNGIKINRIKLSDPFGPLQGSPSYIAYDDYAFYGRMGAARERNALLIANIEKGLSDFRYGDKNSQHEFIFPEKGCYVRLNDNDVQNNKSKTVYIFGS